MTENSNRNNIFMKELSIYQLRMTEMNQFLCHLNGLHMVEKKRGMKLS